MKKIYAAQTLLEAQIVADGLAAEGIKTHIRGGFLSSLVGDLPATEAYPDVMLIDPHDEANAKLWVKQWQQDQAASQAKDSWQCSECSENNPGSFDLCWKCGTGQ